MVDAFLREACDRIETHDQYEIIRICHMRIKLHWGEEKGDMPSKCVSSSRLYLRSHRIQGNRLHFFLTDIAFIPCKKIAQFIVSINL